VHCTANVCFSTQIAERRILYDYDQFGDSPTCINREENIANLIAIGQGVGFNENGEHGSLLETNVTTMATDDCAAWFKHNLTLSDRGSLRSSFKFGLNEQILCTRGILNEETNIYSVQLKVLLITLEKT
jgi:hypothetical protein